MECEKKTILRATVALLLVQALWVTPAHGESFLVARVASIEHPRQVVCRQDFSIAVTFEYASRVLIDVGVFEEESSRVVESLTLISGFYGPGNATFTFNLTAPDSPGIWRLRASTRAWWASSWYSDPNLGSKAFNVEVVKESRSWLNITSILPFHLDGQRIELTDRREYGTHLNHGSYTILAEQIKNIGVRTRLIFDRWSDGVRSNPRVINLFHDVRLATIYRTQHYLTVHSDYGNPVGDGWYDENSTASFAVLPQDRTPVFGIADMIYSFDRWNEGVSERQPIASILMTGPKEVHALWQKELRLPGSLQLRLLSASMILVSILLFARKVKRRRAGNRRKAQPTALRRQGFTAAVLVLLLAQSFLMPAAAERNTLSIRIGETVWRHWQNPESDTCVIWLGGGTEGPPLIINPYWLESYNTMRFVQDIARYYSVLTLETGSSTIYQAALKRTIRGEFYPSRIIHDAKTWATKAGYKCVHLAGYSVGGIAAANEATVVDPDEWSSPNGVVLITVPLEQFTSYANLVKASHLIFYGTEMTKSFIDSGLEYYQSTPPEGQYGNHWLHKEFHITNKVAHEIWTIAQTGTYNSEAIEVTVNFIERSRALQLEKRKTLPATLEPSPKKYPTDTRTKAELIDVSYPNEVSPRDIFPICTKIRIQKPSGTQAWVILHSLNMSEILSVRDLTSEAMNLTLLARAPPHQTPIDLNLSVFSSQGDSLAFPTGNYSVPIKIQVIDEVNLTIKTSPAAIPVSVDGITKSNTVGTLQIRLVRGHHVIEVPSMVQLTTNQRAIFEGWSDGTQFNRKTIRLTKPLQIEAFFRLQYYVSASSEFGQVIGSGWYDCNTTATIMVSPPIIRDRDGNVLTFQRFDKWFPEDYGREVAIAANVRTPLEVKAQWIRVTFEEPILTSYLIEVFASFLLLIASIVSTRSVAKTGAKKA
jgi:hypothetical protein